MYEDVLIATDGSDVAATAGTVGVSLARTLGARVRVLSVAEDGSDAAERDRREADAAAIATDAREAGCEAETIVRTGRPASEIRTAADEIDAGLVVVGTHGRTGVRQVLFGSVALEVIREARRPVLSVGPNAGWDGRSEPVERVLLATDGWSGSEAATDHALGVADAFDAELHALYAVDVSDDTPELREGFEEHGEQTTAAVTQRAAERGLEASRTVVHGAPDEVILDRATETDLLVMGTESKSNLERLVVGSVSQRVVPSAGVPVMTVRTVGDQDSS
ncbi:universal stress protein [Natronococcus occultus]|uniref:Universal stress protein UspA-like protein n=1 Tax=Natronococcus occultus SP4 TaxID=694430 RepID=L0K276_9EURY|nr:universal stress protein [Natronococcus occultus]AGB39392.1 universal stress protein UspA-like protein [Natronococcus occultus SP4]